MTAYARDVLPSFAGVSTFARCPGGLLADLRPGLVAVCGLRSPPRARAETQGPSAIRRASVDFIFEAESSSLRTLVDVGTGRRISFPTAWNMVDLGDVVLDSQEHPDPAASASAAMERVVGTGAFPAFFADDPALFAPLLDGFARGAGADVAVIRLSSRLDLAPETALRPGLLALLDSGVISAQGLTFIGTSGEIPVSEWDEAQRRGATVVTAEAVARRGAREAAGTALAAVPPGAAIYFSIDLSVVDSGHSAGSPRFTIGGLAPSQLLDLMVEFSRAPALRGFDLTGVVPALDNRRRTERLAAEAAIELLAPRVFAGAPAAATAPTDHGPG